MSRPGEIRSPILCYVTDRRSLPLATSSDANRLLLQKISAVAATGVDWVQLREKDFTGREWVSLSRDAIVQSRVQNSSRGTRILINDRVDVALAVRSAGVHLSENGVPIAEARRLSDTLAQRRGHDASSFLVGASCHSLGAALSAARAGANYIYFSPIFTTPSKAFYGPPQGIERLKQVCDAVSIPVLAIGGVSLQNAAECFRAGASGIAAIRLFQEAPDLGSVVSRLRSAWLP